MKTANQVTQVLAWKTADGQLHDSAAQANAHAAKLNFIHWYRHDNQIHGAQTGDPVDGRDLAAWLIDNRAAVLELLLSYEPKEPRYAV